MPVVIGQNVSQFHIIELLGEGGMATVYKAFDMRLERNVAIKFIRKQAIADDQTEKVFKRFEREAKTLAKLSHPNIIKILDYGEYEDSPYLVMEYLPLGTLKEKTGKPIAYYDAARILATVARALEYAHNHGILHRDVKPANILLTEEGEPILSDFGIAKILDAEETTQLTNTGVGIGTPKYMAPEQVDGKSTAQTDVYALGVVFYELVTGRVPFDADTPLAILLKQVQDPLPHPKKSIPDLPDEVEQVLFKALAKNPEDRYANMGEFAATLTRLSLGDKSVSTPPQEKAVAKQIPQPQKEAVSPVAFVQTAPPLPARVYPQSEPMKQSKRPLGWILLGIAGLGILAIFLVLMVMAGIVLNSQATQTPEIQVIITQPSILTAQTEIPLAEPTLPVVSQDRTPGSMGGNLSYPGEAIPPQRIVAFNLDTEQWYHVKTEANQTTYLLQDIPPGRYQVVSYIIPGNNVPPELAGGYTQAVLCGLDVSCTDHNLVDIIVKPGKLTPNINPADWYTPDSLKAFPPEPPENP